MVQPVSLKVIYATRMTEITALKVPTKVWPTIGVIPVHYTNDILVYVDFGKEIRVNNCVLVKDLSRIKSLQSGRPLGYHFSSTPSPRIDGFPSVISQNDKISPRVQMDVEPILTINLSLAVCFTTCESLSS